MSNENTLRTRNWIGTVFEYDFSDPNSLWEQLRDDARIKRAVGQVERAPSTDRLHWQIYIEFKNAVKLSTVRELLPGHWEPRKGSRDEAYAYCSKEESREDGPFECGRWDVRPGHRSDLEAVRQRIAEGATSLEIANEYFGAWVRYHKAFGIYRLLQAEKRNWEMDVWVLWGDTGVGKTRRVYEMAEEWNERVYALPCNSGSGIPWFDGYSGEEIILIDDFYGNIKVSFLLKLLDRYPMSVQVKFGMVPMVSKRVIFTSNKKPDDWFDWEKIGTKVQEAFYRRFTHKIHLSYIRWRGLLLRQIPNGTSAGS